MGCSSAALRRSQSGIFSSHGMSFVSEYAEAVAVPVPDHIMKAHDCIALKCTLGVLVDDQAVL